MYWFSPRDFSPCENSLRHTCISRNVCVLVMPTGRVNTVSPGACPQMYLLVKTLNLRHGNKWECLCSSYANMS